MPGTPATSPIHGAPRYANTDTSDFAGQVNAVTDRFDITAMRLDSGLASARPAAGIANRFYYATDTKALSRDTGSAWEDPVPAAHASRHQDGGADALTVREAMMATGATGPSKGAFSASRSLATAVASGGVLIFDVEDWDVSSWYDPATGRFTPQVAGRYWLSWYGQSSVAINLDAYYTTSLRKNGVEHRRAPVVQQNSGGYTPGTGHTAQVVANGTTDYFDVITVYNNGAAVAMSGWFQGSLIGRS